MSGNDPITYIQGRTLTGWTNDPRGLTLHFGGRRLVFSPSDGVTVEIDNKEQSA